jgi:beta-lactamase class D
MRLVIIALLVAVSTHASAWTEREDIARLFAEAGVSGTFVLLDVETGALSGHNRERAARRYVPASTFKVPNALIGLASGAVGDVDEVLPFGGGPQRLKVWEQDMSLRQGMPVSNLPVFRELARRIGLDAMRDHLTRLDYGSARIAQTVDDFWLVGPLGISAIEQVRFLAALAERRLPLAQDAQGAVADIIRVDAGDGWSLHAKTGWADLYQPHLGWWVGWVQQDGRIHAFALNIDMPDSSYAGRRIELGRAALVLAGRLPSP